MSIIVFVFCVCYPAAHWGQRALSRQLLKITTHEAGRPLRLLHVAMERYESDYSEDFEEEELSSAAAASSKPSAGSLYYGGGGRQTRKRREQPVVHERGGRGGYRGEKFTTPSRRTVLTGPPPSKSRSTGAVSTRTRRGCSDRGASRPSFLPRRLEQGAKTVQTAGASPARDRQLSAMNHKARGLQNRLADRERDLEEVSKENKLLNRLQKKQDKEWSRIQRQEDELPHILSRHEGEVYCNTLAGKDIVAPPHEIILLPKCEVSYSKLYEYCHLLLTEEPQLIINTTSSEFSISRMVLRCPHLLCEYVFPCTVCLCR